MATDIDVPFTNTEVDASADGVKDVAGLTGGFAVLGVTAAVGLAIASRAMAGASEAAGVENPDSGEVSLEF